MLLGFWPAKILSYDQDSHTAQVYIAGLTDGLADGITADFAYPVGEHDKDTERQILPGADVDVYFERGQQECPVIAFYRSHRIGGMKDIRRIRQKNIELLATANITIQAQQDVTIYGVSKVNIIGAGGVDVESDTKVSLRAPVVSINGA